MFEKKERHHLGSSPVITHWVSCSSSDTSITWSSCVCMCVCVCPCAFKFLWIATESQLLPLPKTGVLIQPPCRSSFQFSGAMSPRQLLAVLFVLNVEWKKNCVKVFYSWKLFILCINATDASKALGELMRKKIGSLLIFEYLKHLFLTLPHNPPSCTQDWLIQSHSFKLHNIQAPLQPGIRHKLSSFPHCHG